MRESRWMEASATRKYSSKIRRTLANSFASPPAELMVAYSSAAANGTGLFDPGECGTCDLCLVLCVAPWIVKSHKSRGGQQRRSI